MAVTQYIGSRYVPLFADPVEWSSEKEYEPLTIVLHEGNSFTSKQFVPVGISLDNETFWAETGNYNAQVEAYRNDVLDYIDVATDVQTNLDTFIDTTYKDFVDEISYNRTISDSYAVFDSVGAFTLSEGEHTQGMTIDENGNFYVVIGNNLGNPFKLRKYNRYYNFVAETSLPSGAHGNGLDYQKSYGIIVFDSPTRSLYQYDKNLNLINTIYATIGLGSGAIQQQDSNAFVIAIPAVGNRAFIYYTYDNALARVGEINLGATNACYHQDCFGGSNTFYQLFAKTDEFKHSFVRIIMYRGRKIRDLFILGIEGELEGIARFNNKIYICNYNGVVYATNSDSKWSFSANDTGNNVYSNNFEYSASLNVVATHDISYTNADSHEIAATFPWQLRYSAGPNGNIQNFSIPIRLFGGKIAQLIDVSGSTRIMFDWFGLQMVIYYTLLTGTTVSKITAVETYINGTRNYKTINAESDLDTLSTILANTHDYQINNGAVSIPSGGIYQNFIEETLSNNTIVKI